MKLQCYAYGRDRSWEAICVDLNISVFGTTFREVEASLRTAIDVYLETVAELPTVEQEAFLMRRAPWHVRAKLAFSAWFYGLAGGQYRPRRFFLGSQSPAHPKRNNALGNPLCCLMDDKVPLGTSSPGLPGTVTKRFRPPTNPSKIRWLPRVLASTKPLSLRRRITSCEGRPEPRRRRRSFGGAWARRWKYGAKARAPGEMVQIDHMTSGRDGRTLKEFRAVRPTTKHMVARVCSRATAGNARRFLLDLVGAMPFPVASVQVDGGGEFMADFERACEEPGIPLFVPPPRRPRWNGCVERANRSARVEFWNRYDGPPAVADVAPELAGYEFFHNYRRPHLALDCRTPNEYLVHLEEAA